MNPKLYSKHICQRKVTRHCKKIARNIEQKRWSQHIRHARSTNTCNNRCQHRKYIRLPHFRHNLVRVVQLQALIQHIKCKYTNKCLKVHLLRREMACNSVRRFKCLNKSCNRWNTKRMFHQKRFFRATPVFTFLSYTLSSWYTRLTLLISSKRAELIAWSLKTTTHLWRMFSIC